MLTANLTTDDIGIAIRDFLEHHNICHIDPETLTESNVQYVNFVDVSDPSNPLVHMEDGAQFRVRIFREG
jgi:hypothetical protein